jgi:hypothetical protein
MAHTHDDTLIAAKAIYSNTDDVAQVYPDDDSQWWLNDVDNNTFAYGWYDDTDVFQAKPYHP